jgi:hypothetical protein
MYQVRDFLVVYRYFTSPADLLQRLVERFKTPPSGGESGPIRLRVC